MASHSTVEITERKRLVRLLVGFLLLLSIPTVALMFQAYSQMRWESFHQYRVLAEELTGRIDTRIQAFIAQEELRSVAEYDFTLLAGNPSANYVQRSPLAENTDSVELPGLVSYFQVNAQGRVSTPLVAESVEVSKNFGLSEQQIQKRLTIESQVKEVLSQGSLLQNRVGGRLSSVDGDMVAAGNKPNTPQPLSEISEDKAEERELGADSYQDIFERAVDSPKQGTRGLGRLDDLSLDDELSKKVSSPELEQADGAAAAPRRRGQFNESADTAAEYRSTGTKTPVEPRSTTEGILSATKTADRKFKSKKNAPITRPIRKEQVARQIPALKDRASAADKNAQLASSMEFDSTTEAAKTDTTRVPKIEMFESEVGPLNFGSVDAEHFVFYRYVWAQQQRTVQGVLVNREEFIDTFIVQPYQDTNLSGFTELAVGFAGDVQRVVSPNSRTYSEPTSTLLYKSRLSPPIAGLELVWSVGEMSLTAGSALLNWISGLLLLTLAVGLFVIYRNGIRQIQLGQQQQDFVSAVSHELKTPLTSIRMYGEILKAGWASEEKKQGYYDFIHDESQRLSRLVNNVLQLSKLSHNGSDAQRQPHTPRELMDLVRSKVTTQIEAANFELEIVEQDVNRAKTVSLTIDPDYFCQIAINLVDNAMKFSAESPIKKVVLSLNINTKNELVFAVRDHGPGVDKEQLRQIFKLFYRVESELTRETVGTGIGLALVQQLAQAMDGRVDVVNTEPGAEFRVYFPLG